jgi:hypothetical protein
MVAAHIWGTEMGVLVLVASGAIVLSLALLGYLVVDFIRWHRVLDENDEL